MKNEFAFVTAITLALISSTALTAEQSGQTTEGKAEVTGQTEAGVPTSPHQEQALKKGEAKSQTEAGATAGAAGDPTMGMPDFKELDADGNGKLSKKELATTLPEVSTAVMQSDQNQDGAIDQDEFARFETKMKR